jgi:sarcosine oxidase subunit gamma
MTLMEPAVTAERAAPWSPLGAGGADLLTGASLTVRVALPETHLVLRSEPSDDVLGAVEAAIGVRPPTTPNAVAVGEDHSTRVLWLGPDEWAIVAPAGTATDLERRIREATTGSAVTVVDVSAARTAFVMAGPRARDVLAAGCPIDPHPRVFGTGRCAQTVLARATILLEVVSDEPAYRVTVRPSYARYIADWVLDAAAGSLAWG